MKTSNLIVLLCGAAMIASCKNSSDYKALNASSSDTALIAADSISPKQAKLVKTADMHFKVKNVQQTGENIAALTAKFNGMVVHDDMTSAPDQTHDITLNNDSVMRISSFNTTADMTVKIPTEKLEDFLHTVSHMGIYVNQKTMDIEDKSLDYLASQMKLNSRKELVAQQKSGKLVIKDANSVLDLKDGLVDEQINDKRIDDEVKYSVITLNFYESNTISKEVIANDDPSTYHLPFFSQLGMALQNGWFLFSELIIGLVNLWAIILSGAIVWILVRLYGKRKKAQPVV